MDDILGLSKPINLDAVRRVKRWVAARPSTAPDATIMVSELHCHEDGCPDVETVVAIMTPGGTRRETKIAKPMDEITESDISAAL